MKKFYLFIFAVLYTSFVIQSKPVLAQYAAYDECYYYCQISAHTPACWAYGEYVLKPDEPKNVTPLPKKSADPTGDFIGPAGCKTQGECRAYCQKHPSECPNLPAAQVTPKISPVQNNPDRNISPMR